MDRFNTNVIGSWKSKTFEKGCNANTRSSPATANETIPAEKWAIVEINFALSGKNVVMRLEHTIDPAEIVVKTSTFPSGVIV